MSLFFIPNQKYLVCLFKNYHTLTDIVYDKDLFLKHFLSDSLRMGGISKRSIF